MRREVLSRKYDLKTTEIIDKNKTSFNIPAALIDGTFIYKRAYLSKNVNVELNVTASRLCLFINIIS